MELRPQLQALSALLSVSVYPSAFNNLPLGKGALDVIGWENECTDAQMRKIDLAPSVIKLPEGCLKEGNDTTVLHMKDDIVFGPINT